MFPRLIIFITQNDDTSVTFFNKKKMRINFIICLKK